MDSVRTVEPRLEAAPVTAKNTGYTVDYRVLRGPANLRMTAIETRLLLNSISQSVNQSINIRLMARM